MRAFVLSLFLACEGSPAPAVEAVERDVPCVLEACFVDHCPDGLCFCHVTSVVRNVEHVRCFYECAACESEVLFQEWNP